MPDREQRDLVDLLRQADGELQQQRLSPEADQRLQRLVAGQGQRRAWWPRLALVPVAAAAVALLAWLLIPADHAAPGPGAPTLVAGFQLLSGQAHAEQQRLRCSTPSCTVQAQDVGTRLELTNGTVVRRRQRDLQLVSGQARLWVLPQPRTLKVFVSHGQIEVLGTSFTVRQRQGAGGQVELHEGSIRFVGHQGWTSPPLRVGHTLRWPQQQPRQQPAPRVAPKKPRPRRLSTVEAEQVLQVIFRLRSQQRYREAVQRLQRDLPRVAQRSVRETFSYEIGAILTHHLGDSAKACRHWAKHLRRYGAARYGQEIQQARSKLACAQ